MVLIFFGVGVDPAWLTPKPSTNLDLFVQGINHFFFMGAIKGL